MDLLEMLVEMAGELLLEAQFALFEALVDMVELLHLEAEIDLFEQLVGMEEVLHLEHLEGIATAQVPFGLAAARVCNGSTENKRQ